MQRKITVGGTALLLAAWALPAFAGTSSLGGTIKVGGIVKDETGDRSTTPETFNIYEGFTFSQVDLDGNLGNRSFFHLDLRDINQKSGRARFDWRMTDVGRLWFRYNRHRQLYDADGSTRSDRYNYRGGLVVSPAAWVDLAGDYSYQKRDGDRISYPERTESFLGAGYDYKLRTGRVEADFHQDGRHAVFAWDWTDFRDNESILYGRQGNLASLRLNGTDLRFGTRLSHHLTVSRGESKLEGAGTRFTTRLLQYLGVVRPRQDFQFKYRLHLGQVDDRVTGLKTENIRNDFDLTWFGAVGQLYGGYGYVTNDDRYLTSYNVWRVGGKVHYAHKVNFKVDYASSNKNDETERTLLRDIESSRFKATIQGDASENFTLGVGYQDRIREFPLIYVKATGRRWNAFARLHYAGHGGLYADYSYADDEYLDRVGGFRADNRTATARLDIDRIKDLHLGAGVTWLSVGRNLDIKKWILMFDGRYDFARKYFVELKYNVYNYDDLVLVDRYYTANVVWFNVGYRLAIN